MAEPNGTLQLTIRDVAFGGKGVARDGAKVVFVPFVISDEEVTAEIVREKKKFAEARLISVEVPSPDRVEPRCPYFGVCGGCSYQHMRYERQVEVKARQVGETLRRIGRFDQPPMRPAVPSPVDYSYRNRIRVHARDGVVGFYGHDSRRLVDITHCPIAAPEVNARLAEFRRGVVPDGDYTIMGEGTARFFTQTNPGAAQRLLDLVGGLLPPAGALLVDAYCGAGFFTRHFASRFERVIGIEENEFAIEAARRRAGPRESYIAGDVAVHLGSVLSAETKGDTTVIVDPPATGLPARVVDLILAYPPARVIYVSCDPATLARDLQVLARTFNLRSVTPLDMFPQTAEIETVAEMARHLEEGV